MTKNPTVAGVVLTLNEEKDLPRALRSLSWCDEILVVDSGSTDCTEDVARQQGAAFTQHLQSPPFLITEQRNWALSSCGLTSDWVLFLDADEEISPLLAQEILSRISSPSTTLAYELTPRYWFFGKWLRRTQGYPNWHPRLLKRNSVQLEGGVWESFKGSTTVSRISIPYEHYAFSKGFDDWLIKHIRYAEWESTQIFHYLQSRPLPQQHKTHRASAIRTIMSQFWMFRPPARFFQKYVLQLGILEGWQALLFVLMMSIYDTITVIKVAEKLRKHANLPL